MIRVAHGVEVLKLDGRVGLVDPVAVCMTQDRVGPDGDLGRVALEEVLVVDKQRSVKGVVPRCRVVDHGLRAVASPVEERLADPHAVPASTGEFEPKVPVRVALEHGLVEASDGLEAFSADQAGDGVEVRDEQEDGIPLGYAPDDALPEVGQAFLAIRVTGVGIAPECRV